MAPKPKLSETDVKTIRRRARAGARICDLAAEYKVNRKTITRRLASLDERERQREAVRAAKRLARQVRRERRKLHARDQLASSVQRERGAVEPTGPAGSLLLATTTDFLEWLDRPKNLSARAAFAHGLIRVLSPDGRTRRSVEREDADALIQDGWVLLDAYPDLG